MNTEWWMKSKLVIAKSRFDRRLWWRGRYYEHMDSAVCGTTECGPTESVKCGPCGTTELLRSCQWLVTETPCKHELVQYPIENCPLQLEISKTVTSELPLGSLWTVKAEVWSWSAIKLIALKCQLSICHNNSLYFCCQIKVYIYIYNILIKCFCTDLLINL